MTKKKNKNPGILRNTLVLTIFILIIFIQRERNSKLKKRFSHMRVTSGYIRKIQEYLKKNNSIFGGEYDTLILFGDKESIRDDIECGCPLDSMGNPFKFDKVIRLRSTDNNNLDKIESESIKSLITKVNANTSKAYWFWNKKNNNKEDCGWLGNHQLALAREIDLIELRLCEYGNLFYPYTNLEIFRRLCGGYPCP